MFYYDVYVEDTKYLYTYKSENLYEVGEWCIVNFINRNKMGLIVASVDEENIDFDISKIKTVIDRAPVFSIPVHLMELAKWLKDYYLSDYHSVITSIYPGAMKIRYSERAVYLKDLVPKRKKNEEARIFEAEREEEEIFNEYMQKKGEVTLATLKKRFGTKTVNRALKEKAVKVEKRMIAKSGIKRTGKLKSVISENEAVLSSAQQRVVEEIRSDSSNFFLLKGVTGSGKTEVYINLIKEALREGKGSIFLVPEISLTAQMVERLEEQFPDSIAILHSKMTLAEKRQEWAFIRSGEKKVVLGARSAVFAPVQNLKYIIMDEEHVNTYKQDNSPCYHTKNVAIKRALIEKENGIKVILGSATPSFESYYQALNGDLKLLEMKERYNNAQLPDYSVIDLNSVRSSFSNELLSEISKVLSKNEQVLLILNRKGFSNSLKCQECGHTPECPNCSIPLNYYKHESKLKCHYCGYEEHFTGHCQKCNSRKLRQIGSGTERVEEELLNEFSSAEIVRVDTENVKTKKDYEKIYTDFRDHKYDIMLGTQIIAKGFHFPNVTLVGIINADIMLNFPDFRAGEKTFQLLTQSAGRSGRGEKTGKVLIQTLDTENEVIRKTVEDDFEGYYESEMKLRKIFNYPPYGRIITIILSSENEDEIEGKARIFYEMLEKNIKKIVGENSRKVMLTLIKSAIYKMNGRFRYRIFIKMDKKNAAKVKREIRKVMNIYREKGVKILIDVDPVNLM